MATTKDKVYDAAENVKPYVERAMSDEKLKQDVLSAFATAKELYNELVGSRSAVGLAARVATDDDVRERLKTGGRGPPQRVRPAAGAQGASGPQHDAARRRDRARHPLQPGHRPGDAPLAEGDDLR